MKITKHIYDEGEWRCFSVNNALVSRNGLTRMIASCGDVEIVKKPKFFDGEIFCEFEINGHKFFVEEPYGDNDTYDVCAPSVNLDEMKQLANHMEEINPIKGGDLGHKIYFLITSIAGTFLLFLIVSYLFSLIAG